MSEFGGGKCPKFWGGKCPPGKWLTIEWTYSIIQDVQWWLLGNFGHSFQRQFHICLGYETLSFLFLEQCFQSSLSNEIWCPFFDINNFSIIPKCISFDNDNLPITWMPIYRRSIIFLIILPIPRGGPSQPEKEGRACLVSFSNLLLLKMRRRPCLERDELEETSWEIWYDKVSANTASSSSVLKTSKFRIGHRVVKMVLKTNIIYIYIWHTKW